MNRTEFETRFPPHSTLIGRDDRRDDEQIWYFHDNGNEVGIWKYNRRTTCGVGEIIWGEDAEMARAYYRAESRTRHG